MRENPPVNAGWIMQRESDRDLVLLANLESDIREFTDNDVAPRATYTYHLSAVESDPPVKLKVTLTLPEDLEIKTSTPAEKIEGIHRLFLRGSACVYSMTGSLRIHVEEIHAEGSCLRAFPVAARAPMGANGRNGGLILLRAKRGYGILNIYTQGEDGGTGVPGAPGPAGAPGENGRPAELETSVRIPPVHRASYENTLHFLEQNEPASHPAWKTVYRCRKSPTDGKDGGDGGVGGNGGAGAKGGDSARLYAEINYPSGLIIQPWVDPGHGGLGGDYGTGGAGGTAGSEGEMDKHQICPRAKPGKPGKKGAPGTAGPPGQDGRMTPFCLRLGPAAFGECQTYEKSGWSDKVN